MIGAQGIWPPDGAEASALRRGFRVDRSDSSIPPPHAPAPKF
jgi:hypothetical protein